MIATYASYIWTCYGITAAVFILNAWLARRSFAKQLQAVRRRQQMMEPTPSESAGENSP